MNKARFRVVERLDMASTPQIGTVTIDRTTGTFAVRPLRRHRDYVLPLAMVARIVCRCVIAGELAERRRTKKKGR